MLVSASFEVYLDPLGELLGADDVLGTRLESDPTACCTGRSTARTAAAPEKVRRLHEWLDERTAAAHVVWSPTATRRATASCSPTPTTAHWVGSRDAFPDRDDPLIRAPTARPKQWLKNVLVFAAPGAAGVLDQGRELG